MEKLQHNGTANLQDRLKDLLETAAALWQHDQTAARTTLCELLFSIILIPSAVFDRAAARKIAMDIQDICLSHDFEEISARIRNAFHFDSSAQTQLSSSISIAIQYVEKNYASIRSMQEIAEYCTDGMVQTRKKHMPDSNFCLSRRFVHNLFLDFMNISQLPSKFFNNPLVF